MTKIQTIFGGNHFFAPKKEMPSGMFYDKEKSNNLYYNQTFWPPSKLSVVLFNILVGNVNPL